MADLDIAVARLEVHYINILEQIKAGREDTKGVREDTAKLAQQLADHAKEEMAVYVRKDEFHATKNEHIEIFERLEKVEEKTEGMNRKIWVITSFASMVGAVMLAILSNTFTNIVSFFTHK